MIPSEYVCVCVCVCVHVCTHAHKREGGREMGVYFAMILSLKRKAEGEGEAGSPLSREPNAGLNPRTLRPELSGRQMPNPLSYPDAQ